MKHHTPSAYSLARALQNRFSEARPCKRVKRRQAFTLVEIMIVVVIIGLLAAMAIPAFQHIRRYSQAATFVADLRVFRDAVDVYMTKSGEYPVDAGSGNFPPELTGFVSQDLWVNGTPIGGVWDLEVLDTGVSVAVGVHNPSADTELLQRADADIDDGNLSTGKLRMIDSNRFYWVLVD